MPISFVNEMRQFIAGMGEGDWIDVDVQTKSGNLNLGMRPLLIPLGEANKVLGFPDWGLNSPDHLEPGCTKYADGSVSFNRFGNDEGYEPLILHRNFHGVKPEYREISEDFRLFHNLFYDAKNSKYIKVREDGEEVEVVRIADEKISIRAIELKQFLAIREMKLALLVDLRRKYDQPLDQIYQGDTSWNETGSDFVLNYSMGDGMFRDSSFVRVLGKKLISGYAKEDSDYWPYNEHKRNNQKYIEFIVGIDSRGKEVTLPCYPYGDEYLTPVYFRSEVLNRYYENPSKYSVQDGHLYCAGLWGVQIDNDNADYVIVFLGDIGRDIPVREHGYWRTFNIPPAGGMSKTAFRRSFMAEFANPDRKDLLFKHELSLFNTDWRTKYGWDLFKPLAEADKHCFKSLRIPATDQQNEFDAQIMNLTKVLVDSLNEAEIEKHVASVPDQKGIGKFEAYLEAKGISGAARHIEFLRDLQALRSSGAAHRKGRNYEKVVRKIGLHEQDPRKVYEDLLAKAVELLGALKTI